MPLELDIGAKIRARRLSNHQTLKQLAEKARCSSAYLSQIENGKVSPSIASLKKIADALQAKITDLFLESVPDEPVVVRPDQRVLISLDRWNAEIWSMIADPKNKRMHPFYTIIQPGGGSHGSYSHVGEEFGIVLKGQLEIDLDGVAHLVKENESFYYSSSQPHNWTNPGSSETIVVWVISPPTF
ncbi:MAG: cupin domain-containing protein [Desulfomonile tiedjei]|nr:cupin domain-containing protein [Desulfomonile tiedjei]